MDSTKLESQWTNYATGARALRSHRGLCGLGGMMAVGTAAFSLPSQVGAGVVHNNVGAMITWNNTGGQPNSASLGLKVYGSRLKFGGYFSQTDSRFGGARVLSGSFITNGNATHGVKALPIGYSINSKDNFKRIQSFGSKGAPLRIRSGFSGSRGVGTLASGKSYAVGFRIQTKTSGNFDYGFITLEVNNNDNSNFPNELTIAGYTINNTGDPLMAPEPTAGQSILAMLLLAGAGGALNTWRKRGLRAEVLTS